MARPIRSALLAGAALLASGCSEELGPVPMPVTRIRGVVTEGKRPIAGGWIEFMPVDGTVGKLRSARLQADGGFDADGVAIGENVIRLANAPIEGAENRALFGSFTSRIRRVIAADPTATIRIDLVQEAARHREEQRRGRGPAQAPTGDQP